MAPQEVIDQIPMGLWAAAEEAAKMLQTPRGATRIKYYIFSLVKIQYQQITESILKSAG